MESKETTGDEDDEDEANTQAQSSSKANCTQSSIEAFSKSQT